MNSTLSKNLFDHFASLESPKVGETFRDAFKEEVRGSSLNVAPFGDTFSEEETEDVSVSWTISLQLPGEWTWCTGISVIAIPDVMFGIPTLLRTLFGRDLVIDNSTIQVF